MVRWGYINIKLKHCDYIGILLHEKYKSEKDVDI